MNISTLLSPITAIFQIIGLVLFHFYGWVVVVAILGYLLLQNRRKTKWINTTENILLLVEVPKDNEKKELSAEQMFASLHGILRPKSELTREGSVQEHVSFEIVARRNSIQFYVWTPRHLKDFVESQIYAQYPTVQIKEGPQDYAAADIAGRTIYGTELGLTKDTHLPIKTFASFEVDPLAGITGVLAKLEQTGEEVWIQILARPVDDAWQDQGKSYVENVKAGGAKGGLGSLFKNSLLELPSYIVSNFFGALFAPPSSKEKAAPGKVELGTGQQAVIKAVEEKITKLGYEVKIRIAYLGPDDASARQRLQAIVGGFKQFNTTNLNGFTNARMYNSPEFIGDYQARLFFDTGYILNIEELASLYHLPHKSVETPNMVWTTAKTSEPPSNIPVEGIGEAGDLSLFGLTNFRGRHLKFGIKRKDRGRHMYIIGQTGAGKSFLLQLLTLSDIYHDVGFAIVDPHGDYATDIMKYIPEHRLNDVIYLNPADREFPMAFNPMEITDPAMKDHISSELVGVLKRMFESWGPRLEYILRYTILALLDHPDSTMLDIPRMLNEKDFRKEVIRSVQDPVVKSFWVTEFASWNEKFASEAVAPVLNKVGAFVANPLVRNIIGQKKSAFNIRQIMDEGKILLVNLSRGQVGEDNAAILGALMVTKIQLAAMSRADMPLEDRRPFYLYVDEFQNFATDSFAVILSEARKYGLNLTVANQYVSQMPEVVRDAVFGNVGTMVSFRIGPSDSTVLGKYFEPVFEAIDLTKLHNQNIFISMIIDGEKAPPFSAATLRMPDPENDLTPTIIQMTRDRLASARAVVEADIRTRTAGGHDEGNRAVGAPDQKPNKDLLNALKNPTPPPGSPRTGEQGSARRTEPPRHDNRGGNRPSGGGGGGGGLSSRPVSQDVPYRPAERREPAIHQAAAPITAAPPAPPPAQPPAGSLEPGQPINLR
ncbi:MAG TPA: type IV secretion system DNA-binding domain-containing protein [Candidatus Saccharimonadia bacterium]|nr:type IV secretion system DNA-binding domain-containing protein [Candidatus Saccharimonadia bacterium]